MDDRKKEVLKYFVLAFFIQFVILVICMFLHRSFIGLGYNVATPEMVGDEISKPTIGRLIFAFCSFAGFIICTVFASKQAKKGSDFIAFIIGQFAGTFLWQCIGEDSWNFDVGGTHFVQLESVSVFPLAVLFVIALVYCYRHNSFDWGVWCAILSFSINWFGHYINLGTYPLVASFIDEVIWIKGIGIGLGTILFITGLFCGFKKAKTPKQLMCASLLCYYAIGILAFSIIES